MKRKLVALLSSGLDSTVNYVRAKQDSEIALALTFDYGQRAANSEITHAKKICQHYGTPHQIVELPFFKSFTFTALINKQANVPASEEVSIRDLNVSETTAKAVWVPNRNGIFLNIAAGFAEGLGCDGVVVGFNQEEAQTFPDNSEAYLKALENSFAFSTSNAIKVVCYTTGMNKSEIYLLGKKLDAPMDEIWPCYFSGDEICGSCESCQRFLAAKESQ